MPVLPCIQSVPCINSASPVANLSSADPDKFKYLGIGFGPPADTLPPLGSNFNNTQCFVGVLDTNPIDAVLSSAQAATECVPSWGIPPSSPTGGGPLAGTDPNGNFPSGPAPGGQFGGNFPTPNTPTIPPASFQNAAQIGRAICPDGTVFLYVVEAGKVTSSSQAKADAIALSVANAQAIAARVCMLDIPDFACGGTNFAADIATSGTVSLASGTLPPGIVIVGTGLAGTPTTGGNYSFTLRATNDGEQFATKSYSIVVLGFTTATNLPCAMVNVPYSGQIVTEGGVGATILVLASGTIPPGLEIDDLTGEVSGTPTEVGSFDFTICLLDEEGHECCKGFTLVIHECLDNPSLLSPTQQCREYHLFLATGCPAPDGFHFTYAVDGSTLLPDGLALDSDTGEIYGAAMDVGTQNFIINVFLVPN